MGSRCVAAVLVLCAVLPGVGVPLPACADEIVVERVAERIRDDFYFIDADLKIEISDDAREALASGVALVFAVELRVARVRRFLWDPVTLTLTRHLEVARHVLANRYVLTDLVSETRRTFNSIDEALSALGKLRGIPLGASKAFPAGGKYVGRLRARLDIEALPAPLRPIAYISPSWRLASDWYRWNLEP